MEWRFSWPQPSVAHRRHQRCGAALQASCGYCTGYRCGTFYWLAATRPCASVCLPLSLRFTGTRLSPSLPSQRGQVLGTLCSSAARLPVPGRCSDFTLSRPAEALGSSTSKRFSGCLPVGEARAELACLRHSASCTGGSAREGAAR